MITYSKEAQESYIEQIEEMKKKIVRIPGDIIGARDVHWLLHALSDLELVVRKEHN